MLIRKAAISDLSPITTIYNEEVRKSTSTFDTTARNERQQKIWFKRHNNENFPLVVAEKGGHVVGWACLSSWSDRGAYSKSVEASEMIFIAQIRELEKDRIDGP
ncbi:GNAT family N-acetyltransferase [Acidobacteriota bacterium]